MRRNIFISPSYFLFLCVLTAHSVGHLSVNVLVLEVRWHQPTFSLRSELPNYRSNSCIFQGELVQIISLLYFHNSKFA